MLREILLGRDDINKVKEIIKASIECEPAQSHCNTSLYGTAKTGRQAGKGCEWSWGVEGNEVEDLEWKM